MNGIIGAPDTHASRACFCCQLLSSTKGRDSAECVEGQASLLPLHGDHVIAACGRRLQDVLEVCVLEVADVSGVVAARLQDETCLLCLVRAAILAVWEAPMRTSLLDLLLIEGFRKYNFLYIMTQPIVQNTDKQTTVHIFFMHTFGPEIDVVTIFYLCFPLIRLILLLCSAVSLAPRSEFYGVLIFYI